MRLSLIALVVGTGTCLYAAPSSTNFIQNPKSDQQSVDVQRDRLDTEDTNMQEHQQARKDAVHLDVPGQEVQRGAQLKRQQDTLDTQQQIQDQQRDTSTQIRRDQTSPLTPE